ALALIEPHADQPRPVTLAADKGYDTGDFVMELRAKTVTPHVAQNTNGRRSAIDGRTTRHPGYAVSQRIRKRIEEPSAGPRPWPGCARCVIADCPRSAGNSPSPWRPIISFDYPNCSLSLCGAPATRRPCKTNIAAPHPLPAR